MNPFWTATFAAVSLVMADGGAVVAGPIAPGQGQVLEVSVTSSRVSVAVRETPLADVLTAIGQKAGVKVVLHGDFTTSVTQTLVNVPLDAAIQRLSRWHSVVLIYEPSARSSDEAVLREVWVTSAPAERRGSSPVANPGAAQPQVGAPHRGDLPATHGRQQVSPVSTPQHPTTFKPSPGSDLPSLVIDPQFAMALKRGGSESGTQVIAALVRERGMAGAVNILREVATRDPDQGVRRGAIKALASLGGADAIEAVRATLLDAHPGVRSEAQTALRQLGLARPANK
jgi:hypothetical protein